MCEQMELQEVVDRTGLCKETLYKLMDSGTYDLGAIVPGQKRNTYIFFRPKVEKFINGGCDREYEELVSSVKMMNLLLTNAIASLPNGKEKLREIAGILG